MYCLVPEKSLRLAPQGHFLRGVYGTFYLAISDTFYESNKNKLKPDEFDFLRIHQCLLIRNYLRSQAEGVRKARLQYFGGM